jgi:hypothetical protein
MWEISKWKRLKIVLLLWILFIKIIIIKAVNVLLKKNKNCDNHFARTAFENQRFKNMWELVTLKTAKFHFPGISENRGDY